MCEVKGPNFHLHPAYGITELLEHSQHEKLGELVGTGFLNKAMVLLRYRTGDFASWADGCTCGRSMPCIGPIQGRWKQEHLLGSDGQQISLTALNMHSSVYSHVAQMQFEQSVAGGSLDEHCA